MINGQNIKTVIPFLILLIVGLSVGDASAFSNIEILDDKLDNGPVLELMADVTVCSGSAIILADLPIEETTGVPVDYSYHLTTPISTSNMILTENLVVTSNDTLYVAADDGTCQTVLEVPIEFVLSPVLLTTDVITICSGQEFDLATLDIQDLENTGSPITFHSSNNPTPGNQLTDLIVSPSMTTSVYAFSELGVCQYVLPIPINVIGAPDLFVTTEPVICTGLDLDLNTLLLTDLNNTGAPITVHSALPATAQNEITGQTLNPSSSTVIYAIAQSGNCTTTLDIDVTVTSSLYAGENNEDVSCERSGDYNLSELVTPNSNPGTFIAVGANPYFNNVTNTMDTDLSPSGFYDFEYIVEAEGQCLPDTAFLQLEIIDAPSAGADNYREICEGIGGPVSMGQFLNGASSSGGTWRQLTGPTLDVSDPNAVDFSTVPSDTLIFQYVLNDPAICVADTSLITIDVTPAPVLAGVQLRCSDDLASYTFAFWTNYTNVTVDYGTIIAVDDEFQVQNIPISQAVNITLVNEKNCSNTIHINPPDCDCAFVPLPLLTNSISICEGVPVPAMGVALVPGVGANWYDAPQDGTLLFANGSSYNPSINTVGSTNYWVEVFSLADNSCINESRVEVTLDIWAYPPEFPIEAFGCKSGTTVFFDFDEVANILDPSLETSYVFYGSEADAMAGNNPFPTEYEADETSLNDLYATIEYGGGCQSIVEVELKISPSPDVTFGVNNIDCINDKGGVYVINNDLSQDLSFSVNYSEFSSNLELNNLSAGNRFLQAKNEYGCIVTEWVEILAETGFSISQEDPVCNGNGTLSDPTDDFQTWTFLLETMTGSSGYEIINQTTGDSFGSFSYGVTISIDVPVDGSWYILNFVDNLDPLCSDLMTLGYMETCSTQCGITNIEIVGSECFDNNTPENPFDDQFYLDVEVLAVNASTNWILDGPLQFTGSYINTQRVGPFDIEDHPGILIFQDNLSSDCFYELEFDIPTPCSNACEVQLVEFNGIACDDAFTGPISTDDIYLVSFIFSNINTGKTEYFIEMNGDTLGPFIYDELVEIPGVTSPTAELTVIVIDEENTVCLDDYTVALTPCSFCAESTNIVTDVLNLNCLGEPEFPEVELSLTGTYEWTYQTNNTTVSTELSPALDQLGFYNLHVNHDNLCETSDNLEVIQENIIPIAEAGSELIVNCFDTIVTLQGSTTHPSDILYEWYDSNNVLVSSSADGAFDTSLEGLYYLSVTDTLRKCVSTFDENTIIKDDAIPNFSVDIFPNDTLTCYSEEIEVNPIEDITGHNISWLLDGGEVDQDSILVNEIGIFTMSVMDLNNGCVQEADFEIFKNANYPTVDLEFPDTLNCINSVVNLSGANSSVEPTISNQWYGPNFEAIVGEEELMLEVNEGGTYYLELSNSENGCVELDSIQIIQDQELPSFDAGADDYIKCFEDDYVLNASFLTQLESYTSEWTSLEGNELSDVGIMSPIIRDTGTYYLSVFNNVNYCEAMDTVVIIEDPNTIHSIEVSSDDPLCYLDENGIIVVQDVETFGTNVVYYFNNQLSPDGNILDNQVGGDFEIQIVNDEMCTYDTLITLVDPYVLELELNTESEELINLGDSIHVVATTNILPENIASVEWTNPESHTNADDLVTSIFPYSRTTYEVVVTDANGCVISNSLTVYVTEKVYLYFPNIFSLEPGSNNTEFMIHGDRQVDQITLFEIYDRWGNKVFQTENFRPGEEGSGWDGQYNGLEAAAGVYIYRVEATLKNGKKKFYVGDVTLVK